MNGRDIEREYIRVKKSLEILGYKDPLGLDSVTVVNKVLNDLIKTTEGFKKLQDERDKLRNELKSQGDLILPLRNENMQLTKENNELHKEMIALKDNLEKNSNANMQNITRCENEKEEFKLLLNQKDSQIKNQQIEIDSLKQKMNDLFDKLYYEFPNGNNNLINKTNTNDLYAKTKVVPKGAFEISAPLQISPDNMENPSPQMVDASIFKKELDNFNLNKESWAKDLKLADIEAEKLRNEIRTLRSQLNEQESNIQTLRNKVSSRDNEINNLQMKKYIGDENKEELKIKYNAEVIKEQNEKLKAQIDFLNEENHKLQKIDYFHSHRCREDEIIKLDKQIEALNKENEKLINQINTLNNNNKNIISKEKRINSENLSKLNNELKKINNDLLMVSSEKDKLEKENNALKRELVILNDSINKYKEAQDIQLSNFNSDRLNLNNQLQELKLNNDKITEENNDLIKQIKLLKEANENISNELLTAKSEQLLNNKNLQDNNTELEKVFNEMKDLKNNNINLEKEKDNLQKTVIDLQNKLTILSNKTNNLDNLIKEKDNTLHETRKTNSELMTINYL